MEYDEVAGGCFQHFWFLASPLVTLPHFPTPAEGNLFLTIFARLPVLRESPLLVSQGQEGKELRGGTGREREKRQEGHLIRAEARKASPTG